MPSEKVQSLLELKRRVDGFKAEGRKIVLANGSFDILHVGHLRYLQAAKRLGDVLIVAVNADVSVTRYKGKGRPIVGEVDRAELIAAFKEVDYVTVFEEDTVERVLTTLKPDIHAKGTDYTVDSVPEREVVNAYGGTVAVVGDPKDHSATSIIHKILQMAR